MADNSNKDGEFEDNDEQKVEPIRQGPPSWMLTFADLVSLLLTFFVLIFSFGTFNSEVKGVDDIIAFSANISFGKSTIGRRGSRGGEGKIRERTDVKDLSLQQSTYFYNVYKEKMQLDNEKEAYGQIEKQVDMGKFGGESVQDGTDSDMGIENAVPQEFKDYFFLEKLDEVITIEEGNSSTDYNIVFSLKNLFKEEKDSFNWVEKKKLDALIKLIVGSPNDIMIEYFEADNDDSSLVLQRVDKLVNYFLTRRNFVKQRLEVSVYDSDFLKENEADRKKKEAKDSVNKLKGVFQDTEKSIAGYLEKLGEKVGLTEKEQAQKKAQEAKTGVFRIKVLGSFAGYTFYMLKE